MSDFEKRYKEYIEKTDAALRDCFNRKFDSPDNIVSAMQYSLFAGGKRLRPAIMLATISSLGGDEKDGLKLACALEMIHTYSLIHDDLPAMDNDSMRRGKPTSHIVYGEDIAILAGDALLNFAMETALAGVPLDREKVFRYVRAMQKLFHEAGVNGMIGGQTGDLLIEGAPTVNIEKLKYVYAHKTGALIEAAVLCGAIVAGAPQQTLNTLKDYAQAIGLAFQIVDDILDVMGDEDTLGKPIGSDKKNEKTTYASLFGLASARERVGELRRDAYNALEQVEIDTTFLKDMVDFVCDRAY